MMTSHIIIIDENHRIVSTKKIRHTDKRDLRWKISHKIKYDRRLRKQIDKHLVTVIVSGTAPQFKLDDGVKKKSLCFLLLCATC
ncbi:MAG: hypothetical protein ACHQNT_05620 [Bacteroidia bacterium]